MNARQALRQIVEVMTNTRSSLDTATVALLAESVGICGSHAFRTAPTALAEVADALPIYEQPSTATSRSVMR